ncbi:Universal stress protein family protein [Stieleria neptunia]|uniref:Universal stress protein family protein n=1 Tax=Stieleria neptunia TaxID=2527979 RepID=A0A518HLQ9_9BACT|nr:universal stress protein [Stieleria neptunia]QDV41791.1 Universal stress protein family protein [Stieleria neptunia]
MNQVSNLQRVLVAVGGSANGHVAVDYSIQLANRYGCRLVGIDIVDDDDTELAIYGVADEAAEAERQREIRQLRERARQNLDAFQQRCSAAGIQTDCCGKKGDVAEQLLTEAQRSDLIILSRETPFDSATSANTILGKLLHEASRPMITVPLALPQEDNVLVAYDGSRSAGQALFAFVALGIGGDRKVHVATAAFSAESARLIAQPAFDFLELHGIDCQLHAIEAENQVERALLSLAAELDAGLLVAGACGHSRIREFLLGSFTQKLIEASHLPLFLFH